MTLGISVLAIGKTLEDRHPIAVAFFRVELDTRDMVSPNGGHEIRAIVRYAKNILCVLADYMVRVREVKALPVAVVSQERIIAQYAKPVPPHMRRLEAGVNIRESEPHSVGVDPPQTGQTSLLATAGKEVHPQADSQNGYLLLDDSVVKCRQIAAPLEP